MPAVRVVVVLAAVLVPLALVSCTGRAAGLPGAVVDGGVTEPPGGIIGAESTGGHTTKSFTLVILPGTFLGGDPAGSFS